VIHILYGSIILHIRVSTIVPRCYINNNKTFHKQLNHNILYYYLHRNYNNIVTNKK